ncbi:hypothetical protein GCM10022197_04100 [Microlunatus spumicola]|uniref:Uncharacterized protein n=1 Tax=Microlunatus spumicola TaxID=81499 RepID=A0ABP6WMM9_9ACTN
MWLNLEVGTARSLQRLARVRIDVPDHTDLRRHGRRALVVEAAHTCLPEAAVESLPEVARSEVEAGLSGRLRARIAGTDVLDPALLLLRDELVVELGGTADTTGALTLLDRVYARRLLRRQVPPVVAASCLAWYGHWRRSSGGPSLDVARDLLHAVESWKADPSRRSDYDAQIIDSARELSGGDPTALEDAIV